MTSRWILVGLLSLMVACLPWTVVPIDEDPTAAAMDNPRAFVESIWKTRLLPAAEHGAAPGAGQGQQYLVRGTGRVIEAETSSRSGRLLIDFEPFDGAPDAAILIGPVILGTALRDAAGFIEFSQFTNQLAYADVAIELNRRVVDDVVAGLDLAEPVGRTLHFAGAWTQTGNLPEIVPVELEWR